MEILSKSQRNALWRALAENGLTVGDFSYDRLAWEDGATIHHTSSQSLFQIYRTPDYFTFTSQVGDDPPIPLMASKDFENIVARVGTWGREASDWLDTLDLWESVPQTAAIPGELTPDSDNTPFSASEQTAISAQLKEIAETVKKTYELTAEQSARLDEKFEEAEKASRRMGRKDWGMFFGGVVLSLVLPDIITPEVMGHILTMMQHGIGHLFMGNPPSFQGILSAAQD